MSRPTDNTQIRSSYTILILDDDPFERQYYSEAFARLGVCVVGADDAAHALQLLSRQSIQVLITDVHLGQRGFEGIDLLSEVSRDHPWVLTLAMSADPSLETARLARQAGAMDFLCKPIASPEDVMIAVENAFQRRNALKLAAAQHIVGPSRPDIAQRCPDGIVVSPQHMRQANMVWTHPRLSCVIYGETGTGKEELAKLIHRKRCALSGPVPFVPVNCANLNGDLADSALFGHVKGAFSGADRSTIGLIGEADSGILFLDEVHTLSRQTQYKLLRVLNDGSYTRVGSSIVSRASFQVIGASTRDLDEEVDDGNFLLDLRSRLLGVDIHLPPLRERLDEMDLFVGLFLEKSEVSVNAREFAAIVDRCRSYYWRGNVRQLYKVLQSLVIMATCNDTPILAENLPEFRTMLAPSGEERPSSRETPPAVAPLVFAHPSVVLTPHALIGPDADCLEVVRTALLEDMPLKTVLEAVERGVLAAAMLRHERIRDAYAALAIGRNTFDVKRRKHGLKTRGGKLDS